MDYYLGRGDGGAKREDDVMNHLYVRAIEGRIRIKVPSLKGSREQIRQLVGRLGSATGVHEVSANPRTGSILILYDPERIGERRILDTLGFTNQVTPPQPGSISRLLERAAGGVLQWTLERALQRLIVALI